ncbi:MAG: outer membrane protein assembly factor BamA [Planctomycetota bacterium]
MEGRPSHRRGAALAAAALAALATLAAGARAGEGPGGDAARPKVLRVEIVGSRSVAPAHLMTELTTRAGQPYDPAILDNDIRYLMATGRYRTVLWGDPVREEGGIVLTLTVEERPVIAGVEYRGMKAVSAEEAKELALRAGLVEGPRERYSEARAFRVARDLEGTYRGKSFFSAEVRYFTEAFEGGTPEGVPSVKVVFDVDEGGKAPIDRIRFVGNRIYTDQQLLKITRALLGKTAGRGGSAKGFDRLGFERVLRFIQQDLYRGKGYLDARVELAHLELFTSEPPGKRKEQWLVPRVEIDEGPVYRVGKITLELGEAEGDVMLEVAPEEVLEAITAPSESYPSNRRIPLREGGTFSDKAVEQATWRVGSLLGHHGRIASEVRKRSLLPEQGTTIDVAFAVLPSRPYRVRGLDVRGNAKTRPEVFLREIRQAGVRPTLVDRRTGDVVREGDVVDTWKLDLAKRNIRFTGLVAPKIDDDTGQYLGPDVRMRTFPREDGTVDLVADVNEGETGMLQMGVAVTSDDVAGQIQFVQRNFNLFGLPRSPTDWTNAFTGAGQTLSISASFGDISSYVKVDFEEPYFLNMPVRLGLGYFDYASDQVYFDDARTGWRTSLTRSWSLHPYKRRRLGVSLSFKDEDVTITELNPVFPPEEAGDFHLQRGGVGVSYDSRNNRFKPTEGWRASLKHEIVGGPFGGNKDFSTTEFDLSAHFPTRENDAGLRSVLQFRVRVSDAEGDNGGTVPVFERYFAGGTQSIRGFDRRSVGPVDISTGVPIPVGGNFSLLETIEYTVPLSPDDSMRGAIFYDAGNVWPDRSDFDFGDQKQSAGVGLLMYPGGGAIPISLYLGWIINKQPEDQSEVLSFTIGTMFF